MKKIYLTLIVLMALGTFASAQKVAGNATAVESRAWETMNNKTAVIDTLLPEVFSTQSCASNLVLYSSQNSGYVVGNNEYEDLAKAQRFYLYGATATISDVLGFAGAKLEANATSPLSCSIHEDAGVNGPGTMVGSAASITMADVDTTGGFTVFTFGTPITAPDSFFVNITLPTTAGDTVGFISTQDPCGSGDNLWELWADGVTWYPFTSTSSWQLEIEMAIAIVVDITAVGTEEAFVQQGGMTLFGAGPNPAVDYTTVRMELAEASPVSIAVVDMNGRILNNQDFGTAAAGRHDFRLDLSNVANGTYFYVITTEFGRLASKVNVMK